MRLPRRAIAALPIPSPGERLLEVQLEQAGIEFEREYRFDPDRKWRADFRIGDLLIEVDGATWTLGRHNHPTSIAKEYERTAHVAIGGYRMIRATTEQVNDGTALGWIRRAMKEDRHAA